MSSREIAQGKTNKSGANLHSSIRNRTYDQSRDRQGAPKKTSVGAALAAEHIMDWYDRSELENVKLFQSSGKYYLKMNYGSNGSEVSCMVEITVPSGYTAQGVTGIRFAPVKTTNLPDFVKETNNHFKNRRATMKVALKHLTTLLPDLPGEKEYVVLEDDDASEEEKESSVSPLYPRSISKADVQIVSWSDEEVGQHVDPPSTTARTDPNVERKDAIKPESKVIQTDPLKDRALIKQGMETVKPKPEKHVVRDDCQYICQVCKSETQMPVRTGTTQSLVLDDTPSVSMTDSILVADLRRDLPLEGLPTDSLFLSHSDASLPALNDFLREQNVSMTLTQEQFDQAEEMMRNILPAFQEIANGMVTALGGFSMDQEGKVPISFQSWMNSGSVTLLDDDLDERSDRTKDPSELFLEEETTKRSVLREDSSALFSSSGSEQDDEESKTTIEKKPSPDGNDNPVLEELKSPTEVNVHDPIAEEVQVPVTEVVQEAAPTQVTEEIQVPVTGEVQAPATEEVLEPVPVQAIEEVPEPVTEAVQEPITGAVPEPVTEEVQEPVTEAVQEPVTEEVQVPVTGAVQEPVTEEVQEPVTGAVQEPVTEEVQEPVTEEVQEPVTGAVQEPITEELALDTTIDLAPLATKDVADIVDGASSSESENETVPPELETNTESSDESDPNESDSDDDREKLSPIPTMKEYQEYCRTLPETMTEWERLDCWKAVLRDRKRQSDINPDDTDSDDEDDFDRPVSSEPNTAPPEQERPRSVIHYSDSWKYPDSLNRVSYHLPDPLSLYLEVNCSSPMIDFEEIVESTCLRNAIKRSRKVEAQVKEMIDIYRKVARDGYQSGYRVSLDSHDAFNWNFCTTMNFFDPESPIAKDLSRSSLTICIRFKFETHPDTRPANILVYPALKGSVAYELVNLAPADVISGGKASQVLANIRSIRHVLEKRGRVDFENLSLSSLTRSLLNLEKCCSEKRLTNCCSSREDHERFCKQAISCLLEVQRETVNHDRLDTLQRTICASTIASCIKNLTEILNRDGYFFNTMLLEQVTNTIEPLILYDPCFGDDDTSRALQQLGEKVETYLRGSNVLDNVLSGILKNYLTIVGVLVRRSVASTTNQDMYAVEMADLQLGDLSNAFWKPRRIVLNSRASNKLIQEAEQLEKALPLTEDLAIFHRYSCASMGDQVYVVSGARGTPYDSALFIFTSTCDQNYPENPPKVSLWNACLHEGTPILNPNFTGKRTVDVCLPALMTAGTNEVDTWTPQSSIHEVMIAVAVVVMNDKPYYNLPHRETGSESEMANDYNYQAKLGSVWNGMICLLENPPAGMEELIRRHFALKSKHIRTMVNNWAEEHSGDRRTFIDQARKRLFALLDANKSV